jgi:type I restriction enzyme S subunit
MNVLPLRALVDQRRGITYGIVQPGRHQAMGIPIVRVTDIRGGCINTRDPLRVAPEIAAKYERTRLQGGELLLTLVGTVGELAIAPSELAGWNLARAVALIPVALDPGARWVKYVLQSEPARAFMHARVNTTVQTTLNLRDVADLPVPMPDRETRERIVALLGAIEDKIELNRRMNETLEEMARVLFKGWIIDRSSDASGPEAVDDSAGVMLPRGWRSVPLGEVLELKRGYDLPSAERRSGRVPIISSSGPSGFHDAPKARGPGVVTGRYGTIGKVFLVWDDFWPLNTALYVRDFKGAEPLFALYLLRQLDFEKYSDKGAVPGINRNHVHMESVTVPPEDLQRQFSDQVRPWLTLVRSNDTQSATLAELRDLLLPRLLSGELHVSDAERAVEAVA